MNRRSSKLCFLISVLLLFVLVLAGCSESRPKYAEDLIPRADEMGAPEGLWLYKGNERMRTDGSGKEYIFDCIEIDGASYSLDEYLIKEYEYMPETHRAMFLCSLKDDYDFLYLYDYQAKSGKYLCEAPDSECNIKTSQGRFYADFGDKGYLFDTDGNLLCDSIVGTLENGVLYELTLINGVNAVKWYSDGLHTAVTPNLDNRVAAEVCGDYIYCRYYNSPNSIYDPPKCAINVKTEEVTEFNILGVTFDSAKYVDAYRSIDRTFRYNDCIYVFSVVYCKINEESSDWYWYLHKFDGANASLECDFGEFRGGATLDIYEGKFYICAQKTSNSLHSYFCYEPSTGKLNKISRASYHKEDNSYSYYYKRKIFTVGGYEFYVSRNPYGYDGLFGEQPKGYVYYLERKYGKQTQIMQYGFSSYFCDDICEF